MTRSPRSAAVLMLMSAAAHASGARDRGDWVAMADHRTSAADARTALSLATGAALSTIDPANGTAP